MGGLAHRSAQGLLADTEHCIAAVRQASLATEAPPERPRCSRPKCMLQHAQQYACMSWMSWIGIKCDIVGVAFSIMVVYVPSFQRHAAHVQHR